MKLVQLLRPAGRGLVVLPPYLWLSLFFAVPFLIVLKISFSEAAIAIPPFTQLVDWANDRLTLQINFGNYRYLWEDSLYVSAYWSSLKIAAVSTLLCLLIGYPIAYAIARMPPAARNFCLMLVVLPSWTSFLIRIYAWIGILKPNGLLNQALMGIGVIDRPLELLYTQTAIYIGIVYAYLPFMVLPLYSNLVRHEPRLLEAAADLGSRPWHSFLTVTLPLSRSGIIAGCMLVFVPAVGEFVIPELLGGPDQLMIGRVVWQEFFSNRDWPVAAALASVMLVLLSVPIVWFQRQRARGLEQLV